MHALPLLTLAGLAAAAPLSASSPEPPHDRARREAKCQYYPSHEITGPFKLAAYPSASESDPRPAPIWLSVARNNQINPHPDTFIFRAASSHDAATDVSYDTVSHRLRAAVPRKGGMPWGYHTADLQPGAAVTFVADDGVPPSDSVITGLQSGDCGADDYFFGERSDTPAGAWWMCRPLALPDSEPALYHAGDPKAMPDGCIAVTVRPRSTENAYVPSKP